MRASTVAIRSFANSGWLADIRGLRQDEEAGGLVSDMPALSFPTDSPGVIPLPVTEVAVTDTLRFEIIQSSAKFNRNLDAQPCLIIG